MPSPHMVFTIATAASNPLIEKCDNLSDFHCFILIINKKVLYFHSAHRAVSQLEMVQLVQLVQLVDVIEWVNNKKTYNKWTLFVETIHHIEIAFLKQMKRKSYHIAREGEREKQHKYDKRTMYFDSSLRFFPSLHNEI